MALPSKWFFFPEIQTLAEMVKSKRTSSDSDSDLGIAGDFNSVFQTIEQTIDNGYIW